MKSVLSNHRQSPRKVRLVVDLIRGKAVAVAQEALTFLPKKSASDVQKLLASAVANARVQGFSPEDLIVKTISVDKGAVIRRFKPMARGRAAGIRRTMSTIRIELGFTAAPKVKKAHAPKKAKATQK
jgi:large subunit ribosomal protein L22